MTGDEVFEVISDSYSSSTGKMSYTLELTDYANSLEALYTYILTATAEGGVQTTSTGTMTVQDLCVATLTSNFDKDYYYNIPETGFDWIDLPFDGDSYVDLVAYTALAGQTASCSREYSYRLSDPSANNDEITLSNFQTFWDDDGLPPGNNPDEIFIDSSTGLVKLRNHWDIKTQYEIDIFIKITDGTNDWFLSVPSVFINTVCGPYSTVLTAPTLTVADKIPNSPPIDYSGTFASSNENCPVLSHDLALGAADFDLTDDGDSF